MQAIFGLWGHYWMKAEHDRAIALGETLLAKGETLGDPTVLAVGHRALGCTLFTFGDFVRAREHLEEAISLSRGANSGASSWSYLVEPGIAAQLILAWNLWILGYPEQALGNALQALEQANVRADPYTVAFAHYVTSAVQLLRGNPLSSLAHADHSNARAT